MNVFVVGSTGVLGRRLVRQFAQRGHRVLGLARDARGDATVREAGGVPVRANIFNADSLARAADGAEVAGDAGVAVGVLRCGGFYGPDLPGTLGMVDLLSRRRLPIIGRGESFLTPLHAEDAASAFVAAAEPDLSGRTGRGGAALGGRRADSGGRAVTGGSTSRRAERGGEQGGSRPGRCVPARTPGARVQAEVPTPPRSSR